MTASRRSFLSGSALVAGSVLIAPTFGAQRSLRTFTPEMFGAKGDGATNDSAALARLAAAVNAASSGIVDFRRTTYLVGGQLATGRTDAGYAFEPIPILDFIGCRGPLVVRGNGARLKCEEGFRYGVFGPGGIPLKHNAPYIGPGLASPYRFMLKIEGCAGPVEVFDLELDGSASTLLLGGPYGDTGWQIPASGLALINNGGAETVRGVHTHHHAQDGLYIDGLDTPGAALRQISDCRSDHNGRQGCSIVGGRGYRFERCSFSRTGRAGISSAPGAGVDIEAEGGKVNRDFVFTDCLFSDNAGCGMVADTGDSEGASFIRCRFIGTTNWSAWPAKPRFRFEDCTFAGALVRAHGDPDPQRAAQFMDCTLTDDPALSPTGRLYGGTNTDRPLADLSDSRNMLFARCDFRATHDAVLPWSVHAIYADCTMVQRSQTFSFPRGTYLGRTLIDGRANLSGSRIRGEVVINGRRFARTNV